jgi:hypothetical protein
MLALTINLFLVRIILVEESYLFGIHHGSKVIYLISFVSWMDRDVNGSGSGQVTLFIIFLTRPD